jgi:RHS repeat-associated protein
VTGPGATAFGYDDSGNITSEGQREYAYDEAGRLGAATEPMLLGGYGYYATGQRAVKAVGSFSPVWTVFHYDQSGQLLAESSDAGATAAEYIHLNGQPLAKITGSVVNYIHPDHLGTPMQMTNAAGAKVWDLESRPFGDEPTITGTRTLNLRFPGQYFDEETGLHQNRHRDYAPALGRYVEVDPLLDILGAGAYYRARYHDMITRRSASILSVRGVVSSYSYADANPISGSDPPGLIGLRVYSSTYELSGVIPNLDGRAAICVYGLKCPGKQKATCPVPDNKIVLVRGQTPTCVRFMNCIDHAFECNAKTYCLDDSVFGVGGHECTGSVVPGGRCT